MSALVRYDSYTKVIRLANANNYCRTNSFLDSINDEYFRPRGLYCLLTAYDPIAAGDNNSNNIRAVAKSIPPSPSSRPTFVDKIKSNLRNPVAETAKGEGGLPTSVAQLDYQHPSAKDQASGDEEKKVQSFSRLNNYLDSRAQARYVSHC